MFFSSWSVVSIGLVEARSLLALGVRIQFKLSSNPGLSTCPSVRVSGPSVSVSWTGLSSVRLALGLPQGKLGVILAYVADTSHSKLAPPMYEHAPRLIHRRL